MVPTRFIIIIIIMRTKGFFCCVNCSSNMHKPNINSPDPAGRGLMGSGIGHTCELILTNH